MTVREHSTLGDEEGGQEFTSTDEEVLVLFAAQAATALANARTRTSGAAGPTLGGADRDLAGGRSDR